jgi:hypothetical protein
MHAAAGDDDGRDQAGRPGEPEQTLYRLAGVAIHIEGANVDDVGRALPGTIERAGSYENSSATVLHKTKQTNRVINPPILCRVRGLTDGAVERAMKLDGAPDVAAPVIESAEIKPGGTERIKRIKKILRLHQIRVETIGSAATGRRVITTVVNVRHGQTPPCLQVREAIPRRTSPMR